MQRDLVTVELGAVHGLRERKHQNAESRTNVEVKRTNGKSINFSAVVRLDTPVEVDYYNNGGILQTVLRNLAKE